MEKIGRLKFFKSYICFYIISYFIASAGIILSTMFNKYLVIVATPSIITQMCLHGTYQMRAIDFVKEENNAAIFAFVSWGVAFIGGCYNFWATYFINLYDKKEISALPFFVSEKITRYFNGLSIIAFILLLCFLFIPSNKQEIIEE